MKKILYSDDVNLLNYWEKCLEDKYEVIDDIEELKDSKKSIIIINYSAFNRKEKGLIKLLSAGFNLILVLHRTPNIKTAREVLSYGAHGYGNALMKKHFLEIALETIEDGMIWLHPEFTSQLIAKIPQDFNKNIPSIISVLSQREQEVVYFLIDADTYSVIAKKLNITPRTVRAHAHNIYEKLHVKDRLALALLLK